MVRFLQHKFALTKEGARSLLKGILFCTLFNLSLFMPMTLVSYFIGDALSVYLFKTKAAMQPVWFYLIVGLLALVIIAVAEYVQYESVYTSTYKEAASLRISLAERIRRFPLSFLAKKDLADLSATIMADVESIEHALSHALPQFFAAILAISLIFVGLLFMNWPVALALFWPFPVVLYLIDYVSRRIKELNEAHFVAKREVSDRIQEIIEQVIPIKTYGAKAAVLQKLDQTLDREEQRHLDSELYLPPIFALINSLLQLGCVGVILVGFDQLLKGHIDLALFLTLLVASLVIFIPLINVIANLVEIIYLGPVIQRMKEVDRTPVMTGDTIAVESTALEVDNVSFSYEEDTAVLRDVSLKIPEGAVVAFVGPSGSGKSTMARLLLRFWDVDRGQIRIGGHDIREIDPEIYLQNFSMVFQDVVLFNNTILENIRIGRQDATDEEVIAAGKAARVDSFVDNLPDGYQTEIGENGALLSGGERQRISIARAILKNAPILILDESTTAIDAENESQIQEGLSHLLAGKTVIIIAHRLRTVDKADCLYVFRDGRLVEQGTSEELRRQNGFYAELSRLQDAE